MFFKLYTVNPLLFARTFIFSNIHEFYPLPIQHTHELCACMVFKF